MTRRILITGSRTFTDTTVIREALAGQWGDGDAVLVVGACPRGADALAEACWRAWGGRVERHPADWQTHGRSAGFVRNAALVATGADVCLAFICGPSRGTRHTAALAARAGIPTRRYAQPDATDITRASTRGTTTDHRKESDMTTTNDRADDDRAGEDRADDERAAVESTVVGSTEDDLATASGPAAGPDDASHTTTGEAADDGHTDGDLPPTQWDLSPAEREFEARHPAGSLHGWMFQGDEAAYNAFQAELEPGSGVFSSDPGTVGSSGGDGGADRGTTASVDDVAEQVWAAGMPPEMLDGIEERRTCPAEADDPAELAARLAALRGRIAGRKPTPDQARADELNRWAQEDQRPDDAAESGQGW